MATEPQRQRLRRDCGERERGAAPLSACEAVDVDEHGDDDGGAGGEAGSLESSQG
ncbi:bxd [Drosophila simulans]|uniref:Bxd n=1 Tax=Drosophila simulans TaxID=7240 RepID=B4QWF4_DROSI|nr:bxd [Drosophila simulans]